jgi:hypothetical protein
MGAQGKNRLMDLERRELHLTIFACSAIAVLAIGTAVLMYPVVFSEQAPADRTTRVAFFGFCGLCLLLAGYLLERQRTIQQLRMEMAEDRRKALEAEAHASEELLKTMPKLNSFQDSLPMEFRRTVATSNNLSILVVTVMAPGKSTAKTAAALSDAAKVVSRKLRERDSMFVLGPACVGAVLPGADMQVAQGLSSRIDNGLGDAAKGGTNFSYAIKIVNYPADASSAHELQQAVCALIPTDNSLGAMAQEALI